MGKMMEVTDLEEAWRRMTVRYAYHWKWPIEAVNRYFLARAVTVLARALFLDGRPDGKEA